MEKQLDHFLIKEYLAAHIPFFCQWVSSRGDSDHFPIFLELKGFSRKPGSPYKFNPRWLKDQSYNDLVKSN